MLGEDLSDATNVVLFPSVRAGRPLMERVCAAEPDLREVVFAADGLGLAMPASDLRDRVDEAAALRDVEQARQEGGHWMDPVEERAEALAREAGMLLVMAHRRCQEAHGLARRGETWTPRDVAETTAWLADCGAAQGA